MKGRLTSMLIALLLLALLFGVGACAFFKHPKFGKTPHGARMEAILQSPHYIDGAFRNLIETPKFTQGASIFSIMRHDLLNPVARLTPERPIPVIKTDLKALAAYEDLVIWLGHSSYFIQLAGQRILLDPILSDHAAPLDFFNKAFAGTTLYTADELPAIDYLLISHEHWDHLDYPTVKALQHKVSRVITPLGVGSYFELWGYDSTIIFEGDWEAQFAFDDGLTIHLLPARHYSNRLLQQNQTLWAGFALESSTRRLFFSGDSGYGPHFAEIGRRFGSFDFVALDSGQYDPRWAYIHMTPGEALSAARDLKAAALLPSHVGRFSISRHPWDEPLIQIASLSHGVNPRLLTPRIGEPVKLAAQQQTFSPWWVEMNPPPTLLD